MLLKNEDAISCFLLANICQIISLQKSCVNLQFGSGKKVGFIGCPDVIDMKTASVLYHHPHIDDIGYAICLKFDLSLWCRGCKNTQKMLEFPGSE